MMSKFENPIQFQIRKVVGDKEIMYSDLMEICQGGPEIGTISIDGKPITSYRFGGPFLYNDEYIFAPAYVKRFLKSGFKLAQIDVRTQEVKLLGEIKDLIFLDKIENNQVCFFEDLNKKRYRHYNLLV